MSPAQEQFARVKRYLARMEKKGATDEDTDDLHSFFLHAWHLTDWASYDPAFATKNVFDEITDPIRKCKDIAHRAKHLELTKPPRKAPEITGKDIRVGLASNPISRRPAEASYIFTFPDGTQRDALELAREVVMEWEVILRRHAIAV